MLTLLAFVALVAFIFWVMCVIGDRPTRKQAETLAAWTRQPCDRSGCPYLGWIPVTRRDTGELVLVCSGDYADGQLRGWWTA